MILPVSEISAVSSSVLEHALTTTEKASPASFSEWFTQQINEVEQLEHKAQVGLLEVASGQANNLHQVMIDLEQAKLSFQLVLQVRNRALEAYQELMRMQI